MVKFKIGDKVRWNQSNENVAYIITKIHEVEGVLYISLWNRWNLIEWYSAENFDLIL